MAKKPITLDKLAYMTQRGFADLEEKMATKDDFQHVVRSLETMTETLRKMQTSLERSLQDHHTVETDVALLTKRVARIEKRLGVRP